MTREEYRDVALDILVGLYGSPDEVDNNLEADGFNDVEIVNIKKQMDIIGKRVLKQYNKHQKKQKRIERKNKYV